MISKILVGKRKGRSLPMSRLSGRAEPRPEDQENQRAEAFPDIPLLGITPKEKAIIAMWDRRVEMEGFASVMEAIRNTVPGLKDRAIAGPHNYDQIPAMIDRSKARGRTSTRTSTRTSRRTRSLRARHSRWLTLRLL